MTSNQFTLRKLLYLVLASAIVAFVFKKLGNRRVSGWSYSGVVIPTSQLLSIEISSYGYRSEKPKSAIGFIRIQSDSVIVSQLCPMG